MRYKKQIIIICLFTFLFLPVSGKYEEPKAFDLVITPSVILLGAALALTTGVVISNPGQMQEIGHRIIDGIKNIPGAIEEVGNRIKINATDQVIDVVKGICSALPSDVIVSDFLLNNTDIATKHVYTFKFTDIWKGGVNNYYSIDVTPNSDCYSVTFGTSSTVKHSIKLKAGQKYTFSLTATFNGVIGNNYDYTFSLSDGVNYFLNKNNVNSISTIPTLYFRDAYNNIVSCFYEGYWDIPLEVDMTGVNESYDEEKIGTYLPSGDSFISIPKDTPYPDIYDKPYDSPSVIPGIEIDSGSKDDVVVPDIPSDSVGDTPVTGNSLWDTLFGWLKTLIQPIIDLLSAILGFFINLLDKLRELLIELFVPSEGIFVDAFNGWRSDLEAKFGLDLSVIDGLQSVEEQGIKDIKFTVMGVDVVLPLSFVNKFASTSRTFTTGLVIIFLAWYQYRNAYKLIRNSSPIEGDGGGKK